MAAIMGLGIFIGKQLDAYWAFEQSIMTAVCAMLSMVIAFYLVLKDVSRS